MGSTRHRLIPLLALPPLLWAAGATAQTAAQLDRATSPVRRTAPGAEHRLAVEVAGLLQGLDDRMASPVRYSGTGVAVGITYGGRAGPWQWDARGVLAGPRLTSRITTAVGGFEDTAWGALSADLVRRLWRRPGVWVGAGAGVAAELGVRRHVYTHDTWLNFRNTFVALQAAVRGEVAVGRGRLTETLALPVLGVSVRKEYAGVIRREPRIDVAFPPFLAARHRLAYHRPVIAAFGVRLFHEASLIRHDRPELAFLSHRLGAAIEWRSAP